MRDGERSLLIVVPRTDPAATDPDGGRSAPHVPGDAATIQVIVDRRFGQRRVCAEPGRSERRRGDRRRRSRADAEFNAGRWIVVPRGYAPVDLGDPDTRAILFLCCSQHVVPCQRCQDTYRLGWIARTEAGAFPCPRCGSDLAQMVGAHAHACRYWAPPALAATS